MMQTQKTTKSKPKKFRMQRGRLYFSREAERKFFFGATLFMLAAGILCKSGLF